MHCFHRSLSTEAPAVNFLPCSISPFPASLPMPLLSSGLPEQQEVENDSQNSDSSATSSTLPQDEGPHLSRRADSSGPSHLVPDPFASRHYSLHPLLSSPASISSFQKPSAASPKASSTVEKLPYVPHSPFHLFSYDLEEPPPSMKEKDAEGMGEHR